MTHITNRIRMMTDNKNKRITNKALLDMMRTLKNDFVMNETELNALAIKIVSRMVKLRSMEDWFHHVASSQASWDVAYADLEMTEEEDALGEAARLMTLLNLFQDKEEYEKCAIIKNRMEEINKILRKGK